MTIVVLTALGVGGATVLGAVFGFLFKGTSQRTNDAMLGFSAGVMLSAAATGLIAPSLDMGGKWAVAVTVGGIFLGSAAVGLAETFIDNKMTKKLGKNDVYGKKMQKTMLFVAAIAIHNLPEGIAAGVGFGGGNTSKALTVAVAIALQNFPEGMAVCAPMIAAGQKKGKTFLIASLTGFVEVVGTFIGYFAAALSEKLLPLFLAFAGGTMVYVITDGLIPSAHENGNGKIATWWLIAGYSLMLVTDFVFA